jgi:hypothetical protein
MMMSAPAPPPPPPPPPPEQLGDLKLYRLGERTTIAARQMKQIRLIAQAAVRFETSYRADLQLAPWQNAAPPQPVMTMLHMTNDKAHGLGLPLPAGTILVAQQQAGQDMVLGEAALHDTAKDEKLDLAIGLANDLTFSWTRLPAGQNRQNSRDHNSRYSVTLANASAKPAAITVRLVGLGDRMPTKAWARAEKRDGVPTMTLTLAGGERRQIDVRLHRP